MRPASNETRSDRFRAPRRKGAERKTEKCLSDEFFVVVAAAAVDVVVAAAVCFWPLALSLRRKKSWYSAETF